MIAAYRLLPDSDVRRIHETALSVLGRAGCRILNARLLDLLADHGAEVDRERKLARFSASLVELALASAPRAFTLYDRGGAPALGMGPGNGYVASGHGGLYVLDLETDERRPATKDDAAGFALLSDALEPVDFVAPVVFPRDVPARSASLHALEVIFANTAKHVFFCVDSADIVRPCLDLVRIVAGTNDLSVRPRVSFQVSPSSPLTWTPEACVMLIAAAEAGVPTCILASAMCGVSAPYTLAGTLALHHAETLTGIILAQLMRPGLPCIYSTAMSSFDMRRGHALMGAPESALLTLGSMQLAQLCGIPTHTCFPCTESHCHDQQQAWEKVWTTLPAMLAGGDMLVNLGLFGGGLAASHLQLVLDGEMVAGFRRLRGGFGVSDETLALDTILSVGPGGSFLGESHTVRHLRLPEHWMAELSCRQVHDTWGAAGRADIVSVARTRARELLHTHQPPPLDPVVGSEMRRFVAAYDRSVSE